MKIFFFIPQNTIIIAIIVYIMMRRIKKEESDKEQTDDNGARTNAIPDMEDLCERYGFVRCEEQSRVGDLQSTLLQWYDIHRRDLPWRKSIDVAKASEAELSQRAYEVWVSEIMLQQTRVETVRNYYTRWMSRFPTIVELASSDIEEVNSMWSGLGYYRRAKMLFEGAKMIVQQHRQRNQQHVDADADDGSVVPYFPRTVKELEKIKGIGPYTAAAIASITFEERAPIVDGNVMRVLSRLRCIPFPINQPRTVRLFWRISEALLQTYDHSGENNASPAGGISGRFGDFNQALMELGALVCTPKSPKCDSCPLSGHCRAYSAQKQHVKEKNVAPSLSSATSSAAAFPLHITSVEQLPVKEKKNAPREEKVATIVIHRRSDNRYLFVKRPKTGLLADLWEFPTVCVSGIDKNASSEKDEEGGDDNESSQSQLVQALCDYCLSTNQNVALQLRQLCNDNSDIAYIFHPSNVKFCGQVVHVFTHIRRTLSVFSVDLLTDEFQTGSGAEHSNSKCAWMNIEEMNGSALPTMTKKVLKQYRSSLKQPVSATKNRKRSRQDDEKYQRQQGAKKNKRADSVKQQTLSKFLN